MAFDVLKTLDSDLTDSNPYPIYNFYSNIKSSYVRVTLRDDGDTTSKYQSLVEAVRTLNGLTYDPEISIRDDTTRSPVNQTYAYNYNRSDSRSISSEITQFVGQEHSDSDLYMSLRALRNIIDSIISKGQTTQNDFNAISSLLRNLKISNLDDLDLIVPTSINVEDFLNLDNLQSMDSEDLQDLFNQVPELNKYLNINNPTSFTQEQIYAAIANIGDLKKKLGIDFGNFDSDIPTKLGSAIRNLPNINDFTKETSNKGQEYFPDGLDSNDYANSNFSYFSTVDSIQVNQPNIARIEQLLKNGKAFFNPIGEKLNTIIGILNFTNSELQNYLGDSRLQQLINSLNGHNSGTYIPGLFEIILAYKNHVDSITNNLPQPVANLDININISGSELDSLISDPLPTPITSSNALAAIESSAKYVAEQAATMEGDWDSLDKYSGFKRVNAETVMGSVISPTYMVLLDELIDTLSEITNYSTTAIHMNQKNRNLALRRNALNDELQAANNVSQTSSILVNAHEAFRKADTYYTNRAKNLIPLVTDPGNQINHLIAITWISDLIDYYRIVITQTILGEINGCRYASANTKKANLFNKSKSSAILANTLATPELNQALKLNTNLDDNVIRTTVPLTRINDDDFPEGFTLHQFVAPDVDKSPKRLRNFERDFKGEINSFSSVDIKNNIKAMAQNILTPLKDNGFKFTIVRGLRPFSYEKGKGDYNNSDHHYGLAVDIKLDDPNLTGLAAVYIKKYLPWNKLFVVNFNQGSKANTIAYIHISHYPKVSHGWDKNHSANPPGNGTISRIGGNGLAIPGFDD